MTIHEDAIDLVMYFEGCQNIAYACPAHISNGGTWPYLTIGYGHSGPDVAKGQRITTAQAREMLVRDLANVENMVSKQIRTQLNEWQFGAVCSLAMNLKPGLFQRSRCLAKLNERDFGQFSYADVFTDPLGPGLTGMAREWAEFRGASGRGILRGLVKRRAAELELFFTGNWSVPHEDRMAQQPADPRSAEADMLRPGMRSDIINDLHDALAHAGFPVTCQDAYTWVTVEAVKAFQAKYGLVVDGVYGPTTAAKLNEVVNGRVG